MAGQKGGFASKVRQARQLRSRSPLVAEDAGPQRARQLPARAAPVRLWILRLAQRWQGAGDLAGLPVRAGLSTFPQPRSSTAVYRLTSVLLRSPTGLSTGRYPGRPRAGVIGASSHASPGPPRAYRRSPDAPGALVTVRPAQVAHDHQRRPGPRGYRPGDCRNGAARPTCPATGPEPFPPQSRGVTAPLPIASKPSAGSPR